MTMFKTNPVSLKSLLEEVETGKIRLPEFQRGWVWDDYRIRALLASISRGFPIGAVMTLRSGGDVKFKARLVEGVNEGDTSDFDLFLLDGQQRLTSLYQALKHQDAVETHDNRGGRIKRWYYIDMLKAMDPTEDRESSVISVPESKRITRDFGRQTVLDLSTVEFEYQNHMMPTERLLDWADWMYPYEDYWRSRDGEHPFGELSRFRNEFKRYILDVFAEYQIPVIELGKETPKEAVCTVFEKVNTGGVTLTVFELVTASFAADNFALRDDWDARRNRMRQGYAVLRGIQGEQFLQAVALLATQQRRRQKIEEGATANQAPRIGCQKRDILNLTLDEYKTWADKVESGFTQAAKFLHRQFVFKHGDVPYNTQLVPLAALFVELGHELNPANAKERLEHWYWSGIFSEAYGGAIETQYALDLDQVAQYVRSEAPPRLITEANFNPERLISLRTRNSAAYKGLYALQMKSGAADWRTSEALALQAHHNEPIDIHHIFPVAWCEKAAKPAISPKLFNSIINKTPIDAVTNRIIGGRAPSDYLPRLGKDIAPDKLHSILQSHWLNPDLLAQDEFSKCFVERGEKMLDLIGKVMGRPISGGSDIFNNALVRAGLRPADELDHPDSPEPQEFDDTEDEYDDIGDAAYSGDAGQDN